jgi:hypothetical protein
MQFVMLTRDRFLLARMHVDTLKGQPTIDQMRVALKNLPTGAKGLHQTYDQAMERIDSQQPEIRDLAKHILMWVVHAKRALSVQELQDALAIEPGMSKLDPERRPEPEVLDSLCAGLITVDQNTYIVRLAHYTTLEYFQKTNDFSKANAYITEVNVTYLSFHEIEKNIAMEVYCRPGKFEIQPHDFIVQYPLLHYALEYWGYHAATQNTQTISLHDIFPNRGED